jgi:putative transposase
MPRSPRQEEAGAIHHVFARGVVKRPIYLDDEDRERYLGLLRDVVRHFGWQCLSYCLMGNHVHLLVQTPEPNLGAGMQRLHGRYGVSFNARHGFSGHVFEGRFGSKRVTTDAQLLVAAGYVALNPVAAGLCDRPADWAWSAYGATVEQRAPWWLAAPQLLSYFGAFGGDGLERYVAFVEARA